MTRDTTAADLKKRRDGVEAWLLKRRCTCLDVRGENPECHPCDAIDLIDRLFELVDRGTK
jgi:hypothetical protein